MDRPIIINNFNLCPLTQAPTLGTECLECQYIEVVGDDYSCLCEDDANRDELSLKEIIVVLLDLLSEGRTTIGRDELVRQISDM